jgi:hypothetical protein
MTDPISGVPDENRNYWRRWGRIESQVELLTQMVDSLKHDLHGDIHRGNLDLLVRLEATKADLTRVLESLQRQGHQSASADRDALRLALDRQHDDFTDQMAQARIDTKETSRKALFIWSGILLVAILGPFLLQLWFRRP